jgi:hypothetical protein
MTYPFTVLICYPLVFMLTVGPGSELFKKTFENWELFFKMAEALDLGSKH